MHLILRMILVLRIFQGADPKFCLPSTTYMYPTRSRSQKQLERIASLNRQNTRHFIKKKVGRRIPLLALKVYAG